MATGLSVLIPVYNWDVSELVNSLVSQAADWPGPMEIILLDDGSAENYRIKNRLLAALPSAIYRELPRNVGRAAIRNQLATAAQHEWLLLLDNDSRLPDSNFLARYAAVRSQATVLVGGTSYEATPPTDPALHLRWRYGRAREARTAAQRQAAPYAQLTINNVLLRAEVLARFPLDERLTGYGHEDTKFGLALATAQVPVLHLDNPVLHEGLEPAAVFLEKSRQAVRNLAYVLATDGLGRETSLVQTALRLRRFGLGGATRTALAALEPALQKNLLADNPSLRALDALKLLWLLQEMAGPGTYLRPVV